MSADVLTETDLELEKQCWSCLGNRKLAPKCEMCGGLGSIATEFGDALLSFVRRRLKAEAGA